MDERMATQLLSKISRNKSMIVDLQELLDKKTKEVAKNVKRGKKGSTLVSQPIINQVTHIGKPGPDGKKGEEGDEGKQGQEGPIGKPGVFNTASLYYGLPVDGSKIIKEDMVLESDLFCSTLVIEEGVSLRTNDYTIHVSDTLEIKEFARIHNNGFHSGEVNMLRFSGSGCSPQELEVEIIAGMGGEGGGNSNYKFNPCFKIPFEHTYVGEEGELKCRFFGGGGSASSDFSGGSGAGSVIIYAKKIINHGIISAVGGRGSEEEVDCSSGGGGGLIVLTYDEMMDIGELNVDGGKANNNNQMGKSGFIIRYNNLIGEYE